VLNKSVSSTETRWIIWYSVIVLLISTIPYWIGYASAGDDWRFSGFVMGVEDGNSYIAKMLSGASGAWLFRTPYTAEPQMGFLAFLPYLLLGKLTAGPGQHEQLVVLFHLYRIAAGFFMIFATYDFLALFVEQVSWRKFGLVVITVGGGLGWLLLLVSPSHQPLEFYSPETFGFLSLFGIPHLSAARALLLWGLLLYLLPYPTLAKIQNAILGGFFWLLLGFFQPLTVVIGWAIMAAHLLGMAGLRWMKSRRTGLREWDDWLSYFRKALVMGLLSSPLVFYTVLSFWSDPFLVGWSRQNIIMSPPLLVYLVSFSLFLPFAIVGLRMTLEKYPLSGSLLGAWLFMLPFLAYSPNNLQRRLPEGGWVVVVVISIVFLQQAKIGRRIIIPLMAVSLIPTILLLAGMILNLGPSEPVYQPARRVAAFEYLRTHSEPGDVVIAAYPTSNALPAWAPVRVVVGHGPESVGFADLMPRVERFYLSQTTDPERIGLLTELEVRYVFWGPSEMMPSGSSEAFNPDVLDYLQLIYQQGDYHIYEVRINDYNIAP
jgi:hypothetical protein